MILRNANCNSFIEKSRLFVVDEIPEFIYEVIAFFGMFASLEHYVPSIFQSQGTASANAKKSAQDDEGKNEIMYPDNIKNYAEIQHSEAGHYPGSDEPLSIGSPFGKCLGLKGTTANQGN